MMRKLRRPPRIKVLEASGAIGDGRVHILDESEGGAFARVRSSDASREYVVVVRKSGSTAFRVYSDDNGTKYRGYVGYPIIAVMMLLGFLPRDNYVEKALSGIPWKELNEKFKKYELVERFIREKLANTIDWSIIEDFRRRVLGVLGRYNIYLDPTLAGKPATP